MKVKRERYRSELRGVKIRTFNYWVILAACILYALLLYETVSVMNGHSYTTELTQVYRACIAEANMVHEGSDYLTEQVRLYVVLGEPGYARSYFEEANVTRRRDRALEDLEQQPVSDAARKSLEDALECSNRLMEREIYAMRLVAEAKGTALSSLPEEIRAVELKQEDAALRPAEKLERARMMVFDGGYQDTKALIDSHISHFLTDIISGAEERWDNADAELDALLMRQRVCISLLFVLTVATFVVITILIIKPLTIYVNCIKDDKLFEIMGAYEFKYLALTYNNIYELNAENKAALNREATTDHLTGLMNRGAFTRMCGILKETQEPVGLLICDADNFKGINDSYGHQTGDRILQKVAANLARNFSAADTPARIGGDEFAVLLPRLSPENKQTIADKVDRINRALADTSDGLPAVAISAGVAFSPRGYAESLYSDADRALYKVKESGRGHCGFCN